MEHEELETKPTTAGSVKVEAPVRRWDCTSDPVTDHPAMEETEFDGDWVKYSDYKKLRDHVEEAMKFMRVSGANEREYVVYAVLSAGISA